MFHMETKNQDETVLKLFEKSNFTNHFTVPPVGLSGGLCLSWTDNVTIDILESSPNIIDTFVTAEGSSFYVSFVYVSPLKEDRAEFWEKLMLISQSREEAWLITGDYNELLDNSEKEGGPLRWEGSFVAFRSFVTQAGLWDVSFSGNSLSWRGVRYNHLIHSRLDRAMSNCTWYEMFPAAHCKYLRFEGSDHRPLITFFDRTKRKRRGTFRFDRRLVSKPEIKTLMEESWKASDSESVLSKICRTRQAIIAWTREQNLNSKNLILSTQVALDEALSALVPDPELIARLSVTLNDEYSEEESYWRQRSRIQWLQDGDCITVFFHAVTRGRNAVNKLAVIENDSGEAAYGDDRIAKCIADFYRDVFTSSPRGDLSFIQPMVSEEMNQLLIAMPTDLEIKGAVFSIHKDKAPGSDGFSASFYQSFWDIIGEDVCKDIRSFFAESWLNPHFNETYVRLIPKIKGPRKVADYRPIALCSTHYKIVAKLLSKRMKPLLPTLISPQQSAFVAGRAISDKVLITHEVLHYLCTSKAKKFCSMAIKTDMSKTYD